MELFVLLGLPFVMGLLVFALRQDRWGKAVVFLTCSAHLFAALNLWRGPRDLQFHPFLGLDAVGQLVLTIVSGLFFVVSIYLSGYLKEKRHRSNRVLMGCLLCLLSVMTMIAMSRHMGLLWISLEAATLLSAFSINYDRTPQSIEATWKYLLISSVGVALGLLGTFFLAISATTIETVFLGDILRNATELSPSWLKLSVIFLLVGYGTKMGLAPMHTWKPDAYGEAPAPVGAIMAGALTACAFLAIFRVTQICCHAGLREFLSPILILMGMLSLGIAAIFMTGQKDFNRMLGYSSIEHMGIVVLGIGLGGAGVWAGRFHLINNAFAKGLMFCVAGNLHQNFRTKKVANIQGVVHRLPVTGAFLIFGMVVIAGFPPFGIFYSELLILREALSAQRYDVVAFYFFLLSVIFWGFSKGILSMALGEPPGDVRNDDVKKENLFMTMPLVILTVLLVFTGVFVPDALYSLLDDASRLLPVIVE